MNTSKKIELCLVLLMILVCVLFWHDHLLAAPITNLPPEETEPIQVDPEVLPSANAGISGPKIPGGPVHMFIRQGQRSRFELFFLDLKYEYDLVDFQFYKAWCLQKERKIRRNAIHEVRLFNCYDPNLPPEFKKMDWNRINYIINHKEGPKSVIQEAVWHFSDNRDRAISEEALSLVEKATQEGKEFQPKEGELLAIICQAAGKQPVMLEYLIPSQETFDVAPAFYAPEAAISPGIEAFPNLLPLIPLIPPAIIPLIPTDPTYPEVPPEPPNPVPEPPSLVLAGSALVAFLSYWIAYSRRSA